MFKLNKKIKKNSGMTYVELIVVLSIFSVMSSIILFNYGEFQAKVDIKNLASDIALKIIEAQKASLSGKLPMNGGYDATWKPSYGVYFNKPDADLNILDSDGVNINKKFIYFVNLGTSGTPQNYIYDGASDCTSTSECLDKVSIAKGDYISDISLCSDSNCSSATPISASLSITFKRPNSGVFFAYSNDPSSSLTGFDYAQITIKSHKSDTTTAKIKVYNSGRIQVN